MFYWLYSVLYIFLTIIVSSLIIEQNLKLIFFLIMFLLYISVYNIFITFEYYIKLRNNPGIKGDRGDPGEEGPDGNNGVCAMAKGCGIANCRKLIVDELSKTFPEYKNIRKKISKSIELSNNEKKQLRQINTYIDILIPQCEQAPDITSFRTIISNTIS